MELVIEPPLARHRLTVEQYHRMAEAGVLGPDARVELLEGEIVDMAPTGSRHWAAVSRLQLLLTEAVGRRAIVATQSSLVLGPACEPQPDVALLKPRDDFYASALPTAADASLVIEVADSTLKHDLVWKARLYAGYGVPEYWVVDLPDRRIHRHRGTGSAGYADVQPIARPDRMALPGLDTDVDLTALFLGA